MNPSTRLYQNCRWPDCLVRWLVFGLVRLFYPRIEIRGRENLPAAGPVIFVLNHPNGLFDPILLMAGLHWPVSFLAMSLLFGNPVGKFFCEAFGAMPIYRPKDDGKRGGPRGDAAERNEGTFARCRALLHQGGAMALFPEGRTHSAPQLLELRTGAARIALSTEAEADFAAGVQVVPVGLWYESKIHFRTSVLLVVGEPFDLAAEADAYATDPYETVKRVTERIKAGLDEVVLQAENAELLAAIPVLAAWTAPAEGPPALPDQHAWTAQLFAAYTYLFQHDSARLEHIAQQARRYADTLHALGITDPWTLERPVADPWRIARLILTLIGLFPLALAGFLLSYIPYRLAGPVAMWLIGKDDTQISTFKLIGGALFVLVGFGLELVLAGVWFGWGWALLLLLAGPPLAYLALRWGELRREFQELVASNWFRLQKSDLTQQLTRQRQALARQVVEAVQLAANQAP